ncbi:hypothetical protein [Sporisorium scitamineum]|uniref:Probable acetate kinase n=1 Tax=Sporisorium scitamineum TaxID=49012 RepID=A0A0F7S2L0_9BASI|nr:hypothetical protein [Sporisorium scitamineum]
MENIKHYQGASGGSTKDAQMLCLNAGSSSLKFKLYDLTSIDEALISGSVKLASDQHAKVEISHKDGQSHNETKPWTDIASPEVLSYLLSHIASLIKRPLKITRVVHRIVHGAHLDQCVSITRADQHHLKTLQFLAEFAPLHNAVSVQLIKACLNANELDEQHENVCCFDTAFHRTIDEPRSRYMVDPTLAGEALPGGMELRKFGFHGLSYASILTTLSHTLGREPNALNVIVCHLGSGSSICSIVGGQSFDTTMGLTPLEGLPGATRSGSVDPVLPLHISSAQLGKSDETKDPFSTVEIADGIRVSHAELTLNKHSGFQAVAGTADSREIISHRIVGYLGSYAIKMSAKGGVDTVVFSGGIGESSRELHVELAKLLELSSLSASGQRVNVKQGDKCWQLKREDLELGETRRTVEAGQAVPWFVCKTDEEGEMAREVLARDNGAS